MPGLIKKPVAVERAVTLRKREVRLDQPKALGRASAGRCCDEVTQQADQFPTSLGELAIAQASQSRGEDNVQPGTPFVDERHIHAGGCGEPLDGI